MRSIRFAAVLAFLARHVLNGAVEGARRGYGISLGVGLRRLAVSIGVSRNRDGTEDPGLVQA